MITSRTIPMARRALKLRAPQYRTYTASACRFSTPIAYRTCQLPFSSTRPSSSTLPSIPQQRRTYATPTSSPSSSIAPDQSHGKSANEILEDLQDQYATARDEFEIATEETEKKTVYAADDRGAAREEFDKLKDMFAKASGGPHGEEVRRRVGDRVRELENALKGLEIAALEE